MKVLITGGAGFVGSHLAESYIRDGHSVEIIDDLSTGQLSNLEAIQKHPLMSPRLKVHVETIFKYDITRELVKKADMVIHLAAAVGVKNIIEKPLQSLLTNVRGTEIVLELCHEFGDKPLFIASTSEVYGKQAHRQLFEDDDIILGPSNKLRWSYAGGKLMDEFLALSYFREHKLPVVIGRLFNTVGPRQTGRYGMVLPRFVAQALKNEPITVYGDGTQSRTFTHVADCVHSIRLLMETTKALGEVVNIGGCEESSILALASRIKDRCLSNSEIVRIPYADVYSPDFEDMPRRFPSTEKLEKLIHFKPARDLQIIIEDVLADQAARLNLPLPDSRALVGQAASV